MSKRAASQTRDGGAPLKQGDRPERSQEDEEGPYEDEYEDQFEDEIVEIGTDGQIAMAGDEDDNGNAGSLSLSPKGL